MNTALDGRVPAGTLPGKWARRVADMALVSPTNRRRHRILVVGSGLAGASAGIVVPQPSS